MGALKRTANGLAILGGPAAFPSPLHVGRPNIGDRARLHERIDRILDSRWLTNQGPMVEEFEQRVAEMLGVRHCVAVCNATQGLQVVAWAAGLTCEVIVPSFTFVATAHALRWLGLEPVFADVDPATHNLDPQRVAELVTPRTSAVLGAHVWGRSCDVAGLEQVARDHDLRLLFDAAHAFGCWHGGRPIGGFGDAEVFSFHATKFVNAFEGGAVTTDDDQLAGRIRLGRNFGFQGVDSVVELGTNAKMSEASAAMALTSMEGMEEFIRTNRRNHEAYRAGLAGLPGLTLVDYPSSESARANYQYVVVEVDEQACGLGRDALVEVLQAEGVLARRYFYPGCHRMQPYRTEQPSVGTRLPETERLTDRVLVLPTGTAVTEAEIGTVCEVLALATRHAADVQRHLAQAAAPEPAP